MFGWDEGRRKKCFEAFGCAKRVKIDAKLRCLPALKEVCVFLDS